MPRHGGSEFVRANISGLGGCGFQCFPILIDGDAAACAGIDGCGTGTIAKDQRDIVSGKCRLNPIRRSCRINGEAGISSLPSAEHGHTDPSRRGEKESGMPPASKTSLSKVSGEFVREGIQLTISHFIIAKFDGNSPTVSLNDLAEGLNNRSWLLANLRPARPFTELKNFVGQKNWHAVHWLGEVLGQRPDNLNQTGEEILQDRFGSEWTGERKLQARSRAGLKHETLQGGFLELGVEIDPPWQSGVNDVVDG